jgi:ATP-dependent helicase IRC3
MTTANVLERTRNFCVTWPLDECRAQTQREPAVHQAQVLEKMMRWYEKRGRDGGAGILVLPTGGGKTFTAVRFLCFGPLSEGKKVLWLAHTHHLLEQAFEAFGSATLGAIREPRRTLRLRVVSGTPGHYRPRDVLPEDDVVIATLQTVTNAWREKQRNLIGFLEKAGRDLVVVFDEAHHSPAPTYRKLLQWMQAQGATVLGLTATPVYSDERKQGWLWELFKDGILAQTRVQQLIAALPRASRTCASKGEAYCIS